MRPPTIHLFSGPTLAGVAIPDGIRTHPPVAVGDILRLLRERPTVIAIVDGYFERMAAVWHKEILLALEQGVTVYGAASMGALRAAELHAYGMIGVGQIYRAYRTGTLVADDEVAVAHLPLAQGYAPISTALVDLRDGLARAVRAKVVTARRAAELVEEQQATFYRERSWAQVLRREPRLAAWHARGVPSRKTLDAKLLLARLRDPRPERARHRVPRTWAFRVFCDQVGDE